MNQLISNVSISSTEVSSLEVFIKVIIHYIPQVLSCRKQGFEMGGDWFEEFVEAVGHCKEDQERKVKTIWTYNMKRKGRFGW